ncbi:hypothetical protein GPALN_006034 [Globodera pallida]|nr:hypothetical protein GPALN_006034 [Globodera pallida]
MNGHKLAVTSGGLLSSISSSSRRPSNSRNKSGTGGTTSLHLLGMGTMAASESSGCGALFVGSFRERAVQQQRLKAICVRAQGGGGGRRAETPAAFAVAIPSGPQLLVVLDKLQKANIRK